MTMPEVLILTHSKNFETKAVYDALLAKGIDTDLIIWTDLVFPFGKMKEGLESVGYGVEYRACWYRFSTKVSPIFQLDVLEDLERYGTRVYNSPISMELCDKLAVYNVWRRFLSTWVDAPETMATGVVDAAVDFVKEKGAAVFKPLIGGLGKGIEVLTYGAGQEEVLKERLEALMVQYKTLFLQEFIEGKGYDLRTLVIGDEVVIQYAKYGGGGYNLNSIHTGAVGRSLEEIHESVDSDVFEHAETSLGLVEAVSDTTGLDMYALDTYVGKDGRLYLMEWNPCFGFEEACEVLERTKSDVDIAGKIADWVIR